MLTSLGDFDSWRTCVLIFGVYPNCGKLQSWKKEDGLKSWNTVSNWGKGKLKTSNRYSLSTNGENIFTGKGLYVCSSLMGN